MAHISKVQYFKASHALLKIWFFFIPPTSRLCVDAKEKGHLFNRCQEDGLLEILPYHECDLMSREQPDYLRCLCILQVRNISARYPVFVTGETLISTIYYHLSCSAFQRTNIRVLLNLPTRASFAMPKNAHNLL